MIHLSRKIFDKLSILQEGSEFAGAAFSPNGATLFVNLQGPGHTYAIWPRPGYSWADGAL